MPFWLSQSYNLVAHREAKGGSWKFPPGAYSGAQVVGVIASGAPAEWQRM